MTLSCPYEPDLDDRTVRVIKPRTCPHKQDKNGKKKVATCMECALIEVVRI